MSITVSKNLTQLHLKAPIRFIAECDAYHSRVKRGCSGVSSRDLERGPVISTSHRRFSTLVMSLWVEYVTDSGAVCLTVRSLFPAHFLAGSAGLRKITSPYLSIILKVRLHVNGQESHCSSSVDCADVCSICQTALWDDWLVTSC